MKDQTVWIFEFPIRAMSKDNEKIFNRNGRFFLSNKFKKFEADLRSMLQPQLKDFEMFGSEDLHVELSFFFKNRVHPDIGNLPKSVLDAFNFKKGMKEKVLYKDDRQIKLLTVKIFYSKNERILLGIGEMLQCDI